MVLEKYSMGIGDRFGHEGAAQLRALQLAEQRGVSIVPVWNKSHREHVLIKTHPSDARRAADQAVKESGWDKAYYVDADHIGLKTVDLFLESSDFFTLDVADFIGKPADKSHMESFLRSMGPFQGSLRIPGIERPIHVAEDDLQAVAEKYLLAVEEAGNIYRHVAAAKGPDGIVTEVSIDEAHWPQTPVELFFILAAVAQEGIPAQTIAPKFAGRFLKGIDYVGSVEQFTREFEEDICVIALAVDAFKLPKNLKLSIHSGSDKFSLYPSIHSAIRKHDAGLHLKTAGTTWLEELIGLAAAGGDSLKAAKGIYSQSYDRIDELCGPYESVIDIDRSRLPEPREVKSWTSAEYVSALRHDQSCPDYNPHLRQLLHLGYKIAAEMGDGYLNMLRESREIIGKNVTENLFQRHIMPVFVGQH